MAASVVIVVKNRGTGVVQEYEMGNAPGYVLKAVQLLTDKWGSDFTDLATVPAPACQQAMLLAQRWGVGHP